MGLFAAAVKGPEREWAWRLGCFPKVYTLCKRCSSIVRMHTTTSISASVMHRASTIHTVPSVCDASQPLVTAEGYPEGWRGDSSQRRSFDLDYSLDRDISSCTPSMHSGFYHRSGRSLSYLSHSPDACTPLQPNEQCRSKLPSPPFIPPISQSYTLTG